MICPFVTKTQIKKKHVVTCLCLHLQGHAEDEDCYADIMKDDIIKLDDSSLIENPRVVEMKYKQAADPGRPLQGTANRRLRLRRQRMEYYRNEQSGIYKFETQDIPIEDAIDSHSQRSMINKFYITRIKLLVFVVVLILWVVFLPT